MNDLEVDGSAIKIWDVATGKEIQTLRVSDLATFSTAFVTLPTFGEVLVSTTGKAMRVWDIASGKGADFLKGGADSIENIDFSLDGNALVSLSSDKKIRLWSMRTNKEARVYQVYSGSTADLPVFSPDGSTLAFVDGNNLAVTFIDVATGGKTSYVSTDSEIATITFSPDSKTLASVSVEGTIKLVNAANGQTLKTLCCVRAASHLVFSQDGKTLVTAGESEVVEKSHYAVSEIWDLEKGIKDKEFTGNAFPAKWFLSQSLAYSSDGGKIALGSCGTKDPFSKCADGQIVIWDTATSRELITIKAPTKELGDKPVKLLTFSPDGKTIAFGKDFESLKLSDAATGQAATLNKLPDWAAKAFGRLLQTPNGRIVRASIENNAIVWRDNEIGNEIVSLIGTDKNEWVVTAPDGRFDTNKSLDQMSGLHWVVNNEILNPLPLDIFMRQYYEPNLLQRVLNGEQFKLLPSITDINRVQPKVYFKGIKPTANASDLVDVTIEVQSVTQDVSVSATDKTKKKQLISGVFDLRLFRDGQLVDCSTPSDKIAEYNERSIGVSDGEEKGAWEANDLEKLNGFKLDANGKATFTFHNVRLPRSGEKHTEFSAYAFNADRVKSETDRKAFNLPAALLSAPLKGRAYLVTIGVNASDNPRYNLRYAANDEREMQKSVGKRLLQSGRYVEVIQVPLISENEPHKESNLARKDVIKGVFSLLAGHREEAERVISLIPNAEQIRTVEPEDTLIIAFSGHGYADRNGIFYMLPADVSKDTIKLTPDTLRRTISSDELSLWMRDITAKEMLLIVDACHSAAAVQGKDFKPGPMGSRGLGQLAYDKGMRILAATQADNVALELEKLQQGLLSYALVEEGIEDAKADTEVEFNQLTATEWLGFAVNAVPRLYQDILAGKRGVVIDGKKTMTGQKGTDESVDLSGNQQKTSGVNLQQPALFDFRRKKSNEVLFNLR